MYGSQILPVCSNRFFLSTIMLALIMAFAMGAIAKASPNAIRHLSDKSAGRLHGTDICFDNRHYNVSGECPSPDAGPLADAHSWNSDQQCRSFCSTFRDGAFKVTHFDTGCGFCNKTEAREFTHVTEKSNYLCVPRGVCIDRCGKEEDGCVYSGTCASQICLEGSKSGKPAKRRRVTHYGPRSIFLVDNLSGENDGTLVATPLVEGDITPHRATLNSSCDGVVNGSFSTAESACREEDRPLSDARGEAKSGQCRSYCAGFAQKEYEIVVQNSNCGFCSEQVPEKYFETTAGVVDVCITRETCVNECNPEPPGCVYTGNCETLLCFSGIDSKLPAQLNISNDGVPSLLTVNNSAAPLTIDPPVFASLSTATPDPDTGLSRPPDKSPSPSPSPSEVPEQSPVESSDNRDDGSESVGSSQRQWLAPVLGLFGAALVTVGGIFAACIMRRGGVDDRRPSLNPDLIESTW